MKVKWRKRKIPNSSYSWFSVHLPNKYEINDVNTNPDRKLQRNNHISLYKNNIFICNVKTLETAKQIVDLMENG